MTNNFGEVLRIMIRKGTFYTLGSYIGLVFSTILLTWLCVVEVSKTTSLAYIPTIEIQPIAAVKAEPIVAEKLKSTASDLTDKKFKKTYIRTADTATIRKTIYDNKVDGSLVIQTHSGGKQLDSQDTIDTIKYVLSRMSNIEYTKEMVMLVFETGVSETGNGRDKWSTGINNWKNYGLFQFRKETAEDTLKWLRDNYRHAYDDTMQFYDNNHTLLHNLTYNIPFGIAMTAQYYWRRVPDINSNISTLDDRAGMWKSDFNSPAGLGTKGKYIERVEYSYKKYKIVI